MQTACADSRVPEPAPGSLGNAGGPRRGSQNNTAVEEFAQNMSESIIESFMSQNRADFNQNCEILGEKLASVVIECAMMEASRGGRVTDRTARPEPDPAFADEAGSEDGLWEPDGRVDPVSELQTSALGCPPLSQAGLPAVGSLDYPDAPPTTPLLPELQKSRKSFSQKLKGGLAKVFQPSPPPPTPKDSEGGSHDAMDDHQAELERLMDSLSTDDFEERSQLGTRVEDFAEALSFEIMECVLGLRDGEQIAEEVDLHLLAQRMAESIIASSLDAASMCV
ncbi:uncharacterized protein LOC115386106 [Salarias fasciatus]|uniref:uncharacterized protein LOC115386106 n=1 Tax=Salarias fasciatus TaxID=181472 RepID=UPI001176ABF0|nr:uncharacterized protein LOC115386106 [Salarias fasciatus]